VNTVLASFNTIMGQMTEMPQRNTQIRLILTWPFVKKSLVMSDLTRCFFKSYY